MLSKVRSLLTIPVHRCEMDHTVEIFLDSVHTSRTIRESRLARTAVEDGIGTKIGHYEIRSKIGEGGMGEVYLAEDTELGRNVALKLLPKGVDADADRMRRFVQEAKAAASLSHPHIAHIYEIGEADGRHFIAMEYIPGLSLQKRIAGRPLPLADIVQIGTEIADALDEAHSKGIVHRDIKSANVVFDNRGRVKVLDFGLAKISQVTGSESLTAVKTQSGMVLGTVSYMSPEQALGRDTDARTDTWSLGVILYEMATGRLPFDAPSVTETINKITHEQPEAIARLNYDIPAELEIIIKKALRKQRDERYQSAHDMMVDLRAIGRELSLSGISAAPHLSVERTIEPSRPPSSQAIAPSTQGDGDRRTMSSAEYLVGEISRHKTGVLAAALAAVVLIGLGTYVGFRYMSSTPQAGPQRTEPPATNLKISQLTSSGKIGQTAISPDGKWIVYSVVDGPQQSLWLRQVAMSSNVQIVPPGEISLGRQTFSPDGNLVYYTAYDAANRTGALYQTSVLGGEIRKLLTNIGSPVTFSPDGNGFAFLRNDNAGTGEDQLIIANADGSNERKLCARKGDRFFGYGGPAWSPDGKLIAVGAGSYEGGFHVFVMAVNAETGEQIEFSKHKFVDTGRIAWLPDGTGLLTNASTADQIQNQIWSISYPEGAARAITQGLQGYSGVTLTQDGSAIATVAYDQTDSLWTAPVQNTGQPKQITSGKLDVVGANLAWTLDGRILVTSVADNNLDISLMRPDGTGRVRLTNDPSFDFSPVQSPDGKYIVFGSQRGGFPSLWRMNVDGSGVVQLTNGQEDYLPRISPDGKWIVFDSWRSGKRTLWLMPFDGGEPTQLTQEFTYGADISPDGKFIAAYLVDNQAESPTKIIIIPFEGGQPIKTFTTGPSGNRNRVAWSTDGKYIYYLEDLKGISNLWKRPVDGGPPSAVTDLASEGLIAAALSPDGKQLAMVRQKQSTDVVLIRDFK